MKREGKIRFSVIVPVYNVESFLSDCVQSIAGQAGPPDWECILVDDGSTDQSGRMCDFFAGQIPGVVALHGPNRGLAAARNAGLRAAGGEWVLFLDSDDFWPAGMLEKLRAELDAHTGFDWYVARHLRLDMAAGSGPVPSPDNYRPGAFSDDDYGARVEYLYGCCQWAVWKYCLRRSFLAAHGIAFWPDVRWGEDYPFDLLALKYCRSLYFMDFAMTVYRENRVGSLVNSGLPGHFAGIAAAYRRFEALFAAGGWTQEERRVVLRWLGNVFWPQARAAATRDREIRDACLPGVAACRPLYDWGEQGRGRADWTLYRILLKRCGPRLGLWLASRLHR